MAADLDNLIIQASDNPSVKWNSGEYFGGVRKTRNFERYVVKGFINGVYVGRIHIERAVSPGDFKPDDFHFLISETNVIPKPRVAWQETELKYRGKGICGRIIFLANEFYRGKLGTELWSDTLFLYSSNDAAKKVWQKLEKQGLAVYSPYKNKKADKTELKDRWRML